MARRPTRALAWIAIPIGLVGCATYASSGDGDIDAGSDAATGTDASGGPSDFNDAAESGSDAFTAADVLEVADAADASDASDASDAEVVEVDAGPRNVPLGSSCTRNGDCISNICRRVVAGLPTPVCVEPCTRQKDCGEDPAYFCEAKTAGSTAGFCIPHSPAHCASCSDDSDCGSLSEVCFQAPGDTAKACHVDCSLAGVSACPSDYACTVQTVNAVTRSLCRPQAVSTCADAAGGYCDRVTTPAPCSRSNAGGTCSGQRACLSDLKRYDTCGASTPACKSDCSISDPAGCTESFCKSATTAVTNCGACGNVCPGNGKTADNVTCNASQQCTFSCKGENYDVDGNPANGCEVVDAPKANHDEASASQVAPYGFFPCGDGSSTFNLEGQIPSDAQVHENGAVNGFSKTTGAAPDWFTVYATGGGACDNDLSLTLQVTGSRQPSCYQLTATTDKGSTTTATDARGLATITEGKGAYSTGTYLFFVVEKTCDTAVTENVTYSLSGHL